MAGLTDRLGAIGTGAASGAGAGSMIGPWGTAIGAGIGAISSAVGAGLQGARENRLLAEQIAREKEEKEKDRLMRMREFERTSDMTGINQLYQMRQGAMQNMRGRAFRDGLLRTLQGGA